MKTAYETAIYLRVEAERANDPDAYERAADAFDAIEMYAAATRCRERAAHYAEVAQPVMEVLG